MNAHTQITSEDIARSELASIYQSNRAQFEALVKGTVELARMGEDISEDIGIIIETYNAVSQSNERLMQMVKQNQPA